MRVFVFALATALAGCQPSTTIVGDDTGTGDPTDSGDTGSDTGTDTDSGSDTGKDTDTGGDTGADELPCAGSWKGSVLLEGAGPDGEVRELCTGDVELKIKNNGEVSGTGTCEANAEPGPGAPPSPLLELAFDGETDLKCWVATIVTVSPEGQDPIAEDEWAGAFDDTEGELLGTGTLEAPDNVPDAPPDMPYTAVVAVGRK